MNGYLEGGLLLVLGAATAYLYWLGTTRRGTGGGLALLIPAMIIVLPAYRVMAVGQLQSDVAQHPEILANPLWDLDYTAAMIVTALSFGASIFGGLQLLNGRRRLALYQAIAALWVAGPVAHGILLLITAQVAGLGAGKEPSLVVGVVTAIVIASGVNVYLVSAPHVRALYPGGNPPEGVGEAGGGAGHSEM